MILRYFFCFFTAPQNRNHPFYHCPHPGELTWKIVWRPSKTITWFRSADSILHYSRQYTDIISTKISDILNINFKSNGMKRCMGPRSNLSLFTQS